jgi:tRNA (mo5U34)-methyltransferase
MLNVVELQARANSVVWYHTLDLGQGVTTDGFCKAYLAEDKLPHFQGKTVLDIGAWDGYYSFLAESRGAARVVALDHYAWGVDFAQRNPYWIGCHEMGVLPDHSLDTTEFWNPDLPGKRGFDIAHEAYGSRVEAVVADFAAVDQTSLGTFDIVLFLGVLYHVKEPLTALEAVRRLTGGVAVIETEALLFPGREGWSGLEFTAGCYRGHDYSNWFTPTIEAIHDLCRAAGFSKVTTLIGPRLPPPSPTTEETTEIVRHTAAWRSEIRRIERGVRRRAGYLLHPPQPPPAHPEGEPVHYRALVHAFV